MHHAAILIPPPRSRIRATLVALAAAALLLGAPTAASGHATLLTTAPVPEKVLETAPRQIVLRFSEAVKPMSDTVRLLDGVGGRVPVGAVAQPQPSQVVVPVPGRLTRGSYTVVWRVISADYEPVDGFFVFHAGARRAQANLGAEIAVELVGRTPPERSLAARLSSYLLLLLCVGGAVSAALTLRDVADPVRRRVLHLLCLLAVALAATALLDTVSASARPSASLSSVLGTRFGVLSLAQAGLALLLAVAGAAARRGVRRAQRALPLLAVPLVLPPALNDHAVGAGGPEVLADVARLLAASVWVGGSAFLALAAVLSTGRRWTVLARAAPRLAPLLLGAAVLLVLATVADGLLRLDRPADLLGTGFGRLLLVEGALSVAVVVGMAVLRRERVPASAGERARVVRLAGAHGAIALGLVVVIAVLAGGTPAGGPGATRAAAVAFDAAIRMGPLASRLSVVPARAGVNRIDLALPPSTAAEGGYFDVRVRAALPGTDVRPRVLPVVQGPRLGRFIVHRAYLPAAGTWTVELSARRGASGRYATSVRLPVVAGG